MSQNLRSSIIPAARNAQGKVVKGLNQAKDLSWDFASRDLSVANMDRDRFISVFIEMKRDCVGLQSAYRDIILRSVDNDVDETIVEFDKKYKSVDIKSSTERRLEMLLDLYTYREKYLAKICNGLMEQHIGLDFVVKQEKKSSIYQACSQELVDYLSLLRTFRKSSRCLHHHLVFYQAEVHLR